MKFTHFKFPYMDKNATTYYNFHCWNAQLKLTEIKTQKHLPQRPPSLKAHFKNFQLFIFYTKHC